jgi:hypothetical protein
MNDDVFPDDDLSSGIPPWHLFENPYYPLRKIFDKFKEGGPGCIAGAH